MDTVFLPELAVYGALMAAAAILGFWPELKQCGQSTHDHTTLEKVRRGAAHLHHLHHRPTEKSRDDK